MNKLLLGATAYNWYDICKKLDYCKKHSSEQTYVKVLKSLVRSSLSIVSAITLKKQDISEALFSSYSFMQYG